MIKILLVCLSLKSKIFGDIKEVFSDMNSLDLTLDIKGLIIEEQGMMEFAVVTQIIKDRFLRRKERWNCNCYSNNN